MKMRFKKIILGVFALIAAAVLSSCGGSNDAANSGADPTTVTYWVALSGNAMQTVSDLAETPFAKELMKKLNCTIEYQHPAQGQAAEKFNVMVAMGNLPDIIEYSWNSGYPGGYSKAISSGIIQPLDLEKDAPNMAKYAKANPDIDKMLKTDDGKYFGYPFIRGDEYLLTSAGPIVRADWLRELNMEEPETIDEWTTMLRAFKEKKNAKRPLSISLPNIQAFGLFVGSYGIADDMYVDNGVIKYGPCEDAYKDFLVLMNQWYSEELLDADYASIDFATVSSNIINGVSGATAGSCGSGIGRWMAAAKEEGYELTGLKYPVLKKGDKAQFGHYSLPVTTTVAAITRDCKNKELCTKLLDYGYSEEGQMLFNFGIEGESYAMVDGYPTYTDIIVKNPEGLSMSDALARYTVAYSEGPFIQDKRYMEQYAQLPQQKKALENWIDTDMKNHVMPTVNLSDVERDSISTAMESIKTYKNEMEAKFIMGVEPLEKFAEYQQELRNRGLEKYIECYQAAYDRYMDR